MQRCNDGLHLLSLVNFLIACMRHALTCTYTRLYQHIARARSDSDFYSWLLSLGYNGAVAQARLSEQYFSHVVYAFLQPSDLDAAVLRFVPKERLIGVKGGAGGGA